MLVIVALFIVLYLFAFIPIVQNKFEKEYVKYSKNVERQIKNKDVSQLSMDYLENNFMQVLTFNQKGQCIENRGNKILNYKGEDYDYLPENKKLLVYYDDIRSVKVKNKDSDYISYVVYNIYDIAQEGVNKKYNKFIDIFFFMLFVIILLLSFIFIRLVYKPILKNFDILENSFLKFPNKFTRINNDSLNLEEARKLADQYNSVVDGLEKEEKEKQKAIEAGNSLIINLAHDLKSPITILNGYADVLLNTDLDEKEEKKYLGYIYKSSEDLTTLSNQLFDQIKYQNKKLSLNKEKVDICSVVRNSCANYYLIFSNNEFDFDVDIPESPIICNIDKVAMTRAFNNLLQNIIDHNDSSCKVCVCVKKVRNKVIISVKNTGDKISEDERERLFNPFYQLDNARSKRNSGMGLYIVKQIIEHHNGTVVVTSDEEYGIVFKIELDVVTIPNSEFYKDTF